MLLDAQADVLEPFRDGRGNSGVAPQRMGARDAGDLAVRTLGRCPERVVRALDHEGRDVHGVELGEAALFGAARRMEGKREAQDGDRPGLGCGPTRDPRAQRSTAGHEREPAEWAGAKLRKDRAPGSVELARWSRAAPTRDAVGLLDECDAQPSEPGRTGRAN